MRLALVLFLVCGCGPRTYGSAVHVTLSGAVATAGGGYQVSLTNPDGSAFDGLEPQVVAFRAGKQDLTVVLDEARFAGGPKTLGLRLNVRSLAAAGDVASGVGLASAIVDFEHRGVRDLRLELAPDPGSMAASGLVASYKSDETGAMLELRWSALAVPRPYRVHAWLLSEGRTVWTSLGQIDPEAGRLTAAFPAALLTDGTLQVVLTAEIDDGFTGLARPNGWSSFFGQLSAPLMAVLPLLAPDGPLAKMLMLIEHVQTHAVLAKGEADAGRPDSAKEHSEHVLNLASGQSAQADLDGDGVFDFAGLADHTGIDAYGASIVDTAVDAVEASGDSQALARLGAAQSCAAALTQAVSDTRAAAIAFFDTPTAANAAALVALTTALEGAGSPPTAARCLEARVQDLASFSLAPVSR